MTEGEIEKEPKTDPKTMDTGENAQDKGGEKKENRKKKRRKEVHVCIPVFNQCERM